MRTILSTRPKELTNSIVSGGGIHTSFILASQLFTRCKDYFAADVGHVRRRDSVVGSRSWGQAWRREGRPRSAVGDKERKQETRRAQNGTQRVTGVLFNCLATYTGISYILRASRCPCGTYKAGRWLCTPSDSELGTRSSGLGVPLSSAEHGRRVAGDLRDTLNVDPNPNRIVPLHRSIRKLADAPCEDAISSTSTTTWNGYP